MSQIVLIDFSSIAHPIWHTTASESEQNPNAMSQHVVAKVRALASGQSHVALCLDSRKSFRKDLDVTYKAARETKPAAFFHQCQLALETLRADGFPTWEAEGFEADDIIASAASRVPNDAPLDPDVSGVLIVSSDKDLLQLICGNKLAKNPASGNVLDADGVAEKFGVQPHQILDWLTLVGDASDGVTGVRGVGAKGAAAILNTFGNLDDCYAAMDAGEAKLKPAAFAALNEFRPRLALTRQLLTLRTDAQIPFEEIFKERVPADVAIFGAEDSLMQDINEAMPTLVETESRSPDGDGHEKGTVVGMETSAPEKPAAWTNGGSGLEGRSGKPIAARSSLPATSRVSQAVAALDHAAGSEPADSHQTPAPATGNPAGESARSAVSRGVETTAALVPDVVAGPPVEWERQLEPRSMSQAVQLANLMFQARLFSAYGTAQGVLSTILAGRELGLQAIASLRAFHVIENKPTLAADTIRALILTSGKAKYFRCTERTAEQATFETQRGDDPPIALTFTIAEGRAAFSGDDKAWAKSGWGRNPADLNVARSSSKLARLVYPDVVHGLYAREEFE